MRASKETVLRACALGLAAWACGGVSTAGCVTDSDPASPSGGLDNGAEGPSGGQADATVAQFDAGGGDADAAVPPCSATPPAPGAPCDLEGRVCEYGSGMDVPCDTLATCTSAKWQITLPDAGTLTCGIGTSDACPPLVMGIFMGTPPGPCQVNLDCDSKQGRCECAQDHPGVPGSPATWRCAFPALTAGLTNACPVTRPRLGSACDENGVRCDYGVCELQAASLEECRGGVWVEQPAACSCPTTAPRQGDACTFDYLTCEYGSNNLSACNTVASCSAGQWQVMTPEAGPPCAPAPASACPPSRQSIQGATCTQLGLDCDYGDVRCECNSGPAQQSETTWRCTDPALAGPGCGPRPHLGTPCMEESLLCTYGGCDILGGAAEVCANSTWTNASLNCGQALPGFGPTVACAASQPEGGTFCFVDVACEYGSSHVATCDTMATCASGPVTSWVVTAPDAADGSCAAGPPSQCPASFAAVPRGMACTGSPSACDYAEGRCRCSTAPGAAASSKAVWSCQDPPAGCPRPRPNLGAPCAAEGLVCAYEPCGPNGGEAEMCFGGIWTTLAIDCTADAGAGDP